MFDKHGDGMISIEELKHVITRIGDVMSKEEINDFIWIADSSKDGYLRMNDLVGLFNPQTDRGSLLTKKID